MPPKYHIHNSNYTCAYARVQILCKNVLSSLKFKLISNGSIKRVSIRMEGRGSNSLWYMCIQKVLENSRREKNFWRNQPLSHQAWFALLAVQTIVTGGCENNSMTQLRSSCSVFSFPSRNKYCQISPTNKHSSSSITTVLYLVLSKVLVPDTSEYQLRLPRCKQYCCSETIPYLFLTGQSSNTVRKSPAYLSYGNGQNLKKLPEWLIQIITFHFHHSISLIVNINQIFSGIWNTVSWNKIKFVIICFSEKL